MKKIKKIMESVFTFLILIVIISIAAIISGGEYAWYVIIPTILIGTQVVYWIVYGIIVGIKKLIKKWKQ